MRVVVDAGHGGYDPGAVGPSGVMEKDINLAVAIQLSRLLSSVGGVEVLLTRISDVVPWPANINQDLAARVKMANDLIADLFVSIHCNSAEDRLAHGVETYCYKFGGKGHTVARAIQSELLAKNGLTDRGVKEGNYAVLRETKMPAVLVELAFISNPGEEKLLNSLYFQGRAANALFDGLNAVYKFNVDPNAVRISMGGRVLQGKLIDGATYAPVRAMAEALGKTVEWDGETKTVAIK